MNKKNIIAGIILGIGFGFGPAITANLVQAAEAVSPLHSATTCSSQVQLPQDKEELTLNDVKLAVTNHLLRIGAIDHQVWVSKIGEDIIAADISYKGHLLRHLEIDAVNAEIIERITYRHPVGFEAPRVSFPISQESEFLSNVRHTRQLRRHMLGDGRAWAGWLSVSSSGIACFDDYRFGGPTLEDLSS